MAENESLDLGQPGGQRWKYVLDAVRKRKSPEETAPYVHLLGRYRDQWMEVARQAQSKGYSWTKMIGIDGSSKEGVSRASA